jgi:hypothetical protein
MDGQFADLLWMAALIPVTILVVGLAALLADLRREPGGDGGGGP